MILDANVTGTIVNVVSTVIVAVVLTVLNRVYKAVSNLLRATKAHGNAIRTCIAYVRAITDYIAKRDGIDISPRIGSEPPDSERSD